MIVENNQNYLINFKLNLHKKNSTSAQGWFPEVKNKIKENLVLNEIRQSFKGDIGISLSQTNIQAEKNNLSQSYQEIYNCITAISQEKSFTQMQQHASTYIKSLEPSDKLKKIQKNAFNILNNINIDVKTRAKCIDKFVLNVAEFIDSLSHNEKDSALNDALSNAFAQIILLSTYQSRSLSNKARIFIKRMFAFIAYNLGALLGTVISKYCTDALILQAFALMHIILPGGIATMIFVYFILMLIGSSSGYSLTFILDKIVDKIFEAAVEDINKGNIYVNANLPQSQTTKDDFFTRADAKEIKNNSNTLNHADIVEIKNKINQYKDSKKSYFNRIIDKFTNSANSPKPEEILTALKTSLQKFLNQEVTQDNKADLNKLIDYSHRAINCTEPNSDEFKELMLKANKIIQKLFAQHTDAEKQIIRLAIAICVFNPRSFKTAAMRNSSIAIYLASDILTDDMGLIAALITDNIAKNLSEGARFCLSFLSSIIAGIIPTIIGIFSYFYMAHKIDEADKDGINLANDFVKLYHEGYFSFKKNRLEEKLTKSENYYFKELLEEKIAKLRTSIVSTKNSSSSILSV